MSSSGADSLLLEGVLSAEECPISDHNYFRKSVQNRTEAESHTFERLKMSLPSVTPLTTIDDNAFQVKLRRSEMNCHKISKCLGEFSIYSRFAITNLAKAF